MPPRNGGSRAWRRTVAYVLRRDNGTCWICDGTGADSADHVVPVAQGGTDHPSNLKAVHHNVEPRCNRYKGDRRNADETLERLDQLGLVASPADDWDW